MTQAYLHPTQTGYVMMPWPRGSADANRFFQRLRMKRNKRLSRRGGRKPK